MRIISGKFKGRRFYPPADKWPTRPTTDFAKEGLYNILENRIGWTEISMLDLFGGTGNHGYESISRGCRSVVYVDKHAPAIQFVRRTIAELNIGDQMKVVRSDVFQFVRQCTERFDFIFAGPPYGMPLLETLPDEILGRGLLADDGLFVLEHNPDHQFEHHPQFTEIRKYGTTWFSFFVCPPR